MSRINLVHPALSNAVPTPPTHDEWIAAWRDALARQPATQGDAGLSAIELADTLSLSPTQLKRLLREAHKAGTLIAGRAYRMAIDGVQRQVPVYRIK